MLTLTRYALALSVAWLSGAPARAQCLEWSDGFAVPGTNGRVFAMTVFDDGAGPALYIGGTFTLAGDASARYIARWNGSEWTALGAGVNGWVTALTVFDDGSGPALTVGGSFTIAGDVEVRNVARWDGSHWSKGGLLFGDVRALAVYDAGAGPELYAGGAFLHEFGPTAVQGLVKWNGSAWIDTFKCKGTVYSLAVANLGNGAALFVGGQFATAGGITVNNIARWNGSSWSKLGAGVNGVVHAIAQFDTEFGPALTIGGTFFAAGGMIVNHVASWDGVVWSRLGTGTDEAVEALTVFDDGGGAALYAGGPFTVVDGMPASHVAKWDGTIWSALDSGLDASPKALVGFDDGTGKKLFAGGEFDGAGDVLAHGVAAWDGTSWSQVDTTPGLSQPVQSMLVHDDGTGPALYVGGSFDRAGEVVANNIARWDGKAWSALGAGMDGPDFSGAAVESLCSFDDGSGSALYAGGRFTSAGGASALHIAKWDGSTWSQVGDGFDNSAQALAVFDDGTGPALYAGGYLETPPFPAPYVYIAEWDGVSWSPLGAGTDGVVYALATFDDGSGPALFVGGAFGKAGGASASRIARWDGTTWSPLGSGVTGGSDVRVNALLPFDDGSGVALYVGGQFTSAGGASASNIARWNGSSWSAVGVAPGHRVTSLAVFDDGSGPALFAGGYAGISPAYTRISKWNGVAWTSIEAGVSTPGIYSQQVEALAVFDDGADGAPDLYAGGTFLELGSKPSSNIGAFFGCEPGVAYCFGDGIDALVTADCPCGNFGEPGHGCANSNPTLGGARLFASGSTNPNTIALTCTGVPNSTLCTFVSGTLDVASGTVFGDGIRCASGTIVRFGQQSAGQGGNAVNTVAAPAATVAPGNTRYYQVQYRNPSAGFCPPEIFNVSNAYRLAW